MRSPKKTSALFELIRKDDKAAQRLKVPGWWRSRQNDGQPTERTARWHRWAMVLFRPIGPRWPLGLWGVVVGLLIGLPIGGFYLGKGYSLGELPLSVKAVRDGPVNPALTQGLAGVSADDGTPAVAPARPTGSAGDPRVPGLNYYCLETMPARFRREAERAVAFLKKNAVDAAVINVQNNKIQLIALRGFEKPSSDPQARQYANMLRSLGQAWKAEQKGWSDWKDLYAIKYNPQPR